MILCLQDQAAEAFPKRSLIHLNSIDDLNRSGIECWVEKCGVGVGQRTVIRRSNPRTTSGDLLSPISIVAHTPRITKNSRTTVIFCVSERERAVQWSAFLHQDALVGSSISLGFAIMPDNR